MFRVKRIYEPKSEDDGKRYLVDRIWPRGMSREKAALDGWLKDVAPSKELRTWFAHDPAKWEQFQKDYRKELSAPQALDVIQRLRKEAEKETVTLLFSAKEPRYNNAVCLKKVLEDG